MTIKIPEPVRKQALESIQRYASANLDEDLSELAADMLLDFFIEDIGPAIYNQAVADVQERLQARVMEVDAEVYADEFQYWPRMARKRGA
ncbi:DUF2164 domain-containing protein [Lysobacter ciconiae]|uniref:DUF2164 domain-containing protein n=1 Tax=Novilysobacter ciconiae TaxID=2781022 RepID=A0A7S6ZR84_9GAMM|nr:DUF2164 domain-containing protein [Lysobacter ciconiae]QOW18498.1 DUF2164 domain-containing protein [Lysobacter ciconiae]